jgi:hypothetical protein
MSRLSSSKLGLAALGVFATFSVACGDVQLPPPVAPAKELPTPPELPDDRTPEGAGRVVLDASGEKARVVEIAGATVESRGYQFQLVAQRAICASTPCVVDVPRGPHRFVFVSHSDPTHMSDTEIDVGSRTKVVRHALGERIEHGALKAGSGAALTLGTLGAITGGSILLVGAIVSSSPSTSDPNKGSGLVGAGGAVLGISAGVLALGITLGILGRTEVRQGSTTEWTLDDSGTAPRVPKGTSTGTHVRLVPGAGGLGLAF